MQQTITAKLQILVNPSEKQILCDTMKAYSDACNYVSEYIYNTIYSLWGYNQVVFYNKFANYASNNYDENWY